MWKLTFFIFDIIEFEFKFKPSILAFNKNDFAIISFTLSIRSTILISISDVSFRTTDTVVSDAINSFYPKKNDSETLKFWTEGQS